MNAVYRRLFPHAKKDLDDGETSDDDGENVHSEEAKNEDVLEEEEEDETDT